MATNARRSGARGAWLAIGLATAAVLAGHGVTYAIVHPDAHERAGILAATGHAYLHLLEGPAIATAIATAAAAALVGLGRLGAVPDDRSLFRALAGLQVSGFLAMELAERLAAGRVEHGARVAALLVVGVVVQLSLAAVGVRVLRSFRRGAERLLVALGGSPATPPTGLLVRLVASSTPVSRLAVGSVAARGPPSPLG